MRQLLFCGAAILFLSACQTLPDQTDDDSAWIQGQIGHNAELPETWDLSARTGLVIGSKNEQANLVWQRTPELSSPRNNLIRLFGPFGAGAVTLSYGERNVLLTDNEGRRFKGDNAEELLLDIIGWPLPLSALQYWLLAEPAPNTVYEIQLDADEKLTAMRQMGWEIEYSDWRDYDGRTLPRKIFARKQPTSKSAKKVTVKVVIKSWQWAQES